MAWHILADQPEEYIQAQVNLLFVNSPDLKIT